MSNNNDAFCDTFQQRDTFAVKRFNFKNTNTINNPRTTQIINGVLNPDNEPSRTLIHIPVKKQLFNNNSSHHSGSKSVAQCNNIPEKLEGSYSNLCSDSFSTGSKKSTLLATADDDDDFFDSFKNKDWSKTKRFNFKPIHKLNQFQNNESLQPSESLQVSNKSTVTKIHTAEEKFTSCKLNSDIANGVPKTVNSSYKLNSSHMSQPQSKKSEKRSVNSKPLKLKKLEHITSPKINSSSLKCKNNSSAVSPFFRHNPAESSKTEICGSPINLKVSGSSETVTNTDRTCEGDVKIDGQDKNSATSPVIKQKKFMFKKKVTLSLSSSGCSLSQIEKSPEKVNPYKLPVKKEYSQIASSLFRADKVKKKVLSQGSDTEKDKNVLDFNSDGFGSMQDLSDVRKSVDSSIENNEVTFVSQSLQVSDADYMDDEEFERRFGSLADSIFDSVNTSVDNKQIVLSDSEQLNKSNTPDISDLLNEISDVNWDEEVFTEESSSVSVVPGFDNRKDDSKEFRGTYPHSEVMLEVLHQKFGLRSFRPHQREIINASLTGQDCFVLMPTGGGKSLCYQLPAILMPGVTVVISPLRALISDQVDKLNALDIAASHLCSDVSRDDVNLIMAKLHVREPLVKLLYLTPEKINASRTVVETLQSLYNRGKLARFVIDEAHCLSQWGHDFRPDYKQLSLLRNNYKDVPIICLTATATKQVENDVINILKLRNVKRFITSFNRPNIKYQVVQKKGTKATVEIASLIKKKFPKMSGIVYCLSRHDCDHLAEEFNNMGIKCKPYHAGMNDKVREVIQREWMQDRFHVIAATIAFGLGIDKPDVRFVIHNSIPKSVEAFYQESGRAGRDGEISYSYLFYSYSDVGRLKRIMQLDKKVNKKSLNAHFENLNQMVAFAENVVDCRRCLQLLHLGEKFDRQICIRNKGTICDNCENINTYKTMDVTKEAKELCSIIKDLSPKDNITQLHVVDVYRGSKIKKILQKGHDRNRFYGSGANHERHDVQRILKELVLKHILQDHCVYTGEFPQVYVVPGQKFNMISNPGIKIIIPVSTDRQIKPSSRHSEQDYPELDLPVKEVERPKTTTKSAGSLKPSTSAAVKKAPISKLNLMQIKVQCHEDLLEECRRLAVEKNLTLSSIMNLSAIKSMSDVLPSSKEEFLKIQHVTNANYNKFGEFFLTITKKYREKVDALEAACKATVPEDDEDVWAGASTSATSKRQGVKRKAPTKAAKYAGKRFKKSNRKSRAPKKRKGTTKKNSGWLAKKGGGGGGGSKLGLMPFQIK